MEESGELSRSNGRIIREPLINRREKQMLKYTLYLGLVLVAELVFCMNEEPIIDDFVINMPESRSCNNILTIQNRLITGALLCSEYPDSSCTKDQNCWNRLTYLSVFHNIPNANPLSLEQDLLLKKVKRQTNISNWFLWGGIGVSILADACGFLSFLGLLNTESKLSIVLTSSIIPATSLFATLVGLLSINTMSTCWNLAHDDDQTIHEKVGEELEQMAIFLVRASFSDNKLNRDSATYIASLIDIDKLRDSYIKVSQFKFAQAERAVEPLVDVVAYLKNKEILGNSLCISHEIRLYLIEQQIAAANS